MRYPGLALLLALAVCISGGAGTAKPPAAVAKPGDAAALLDGLSKPRQKGRYAPRDDCGKLPGAAAFRRKLADAVARHDATALAALASSDVKLGFGGDDGRARFLAALKSPKGELMAEIARLLPLGCAVDAEGDLSAPWFFAQDMGDIDGYAASIVTGEDVPLLAAPNAKAAVRQRISWDRVDLNAGLDPQKKFQQVDTPGGAKGFIGTSRLRSLLDYRLIASREKGEWRITAILAGD